MTDYRAQPEDWETQKKWLDDCQDARCLLELRARVEALEAMRETEKAAVAQARSLVNRVAGRFNDGNGDDENARAAIREVLAYLREHELIGSYVEGQLNTELRQ